MCVVFFIIIAGPQTGTWAGDPDFSFLFPFRLFLVVFYTALPQRWRVGGAGWGG